MPASFSTKLDRLVRTEVPASRLLEDGVFGEGEHQLEWQLGYLPGSLSGIPMATLVHHSDMEGVRLDKHLYPSPFQAGVVRARFRSAKSEWVWLVLRYWFSEDENKVPGWTILSEEVNHDVHQEEKQRDLEKRLQEAHTELERLRLRLSGFAAEETIGKSVKMQELSAVLPMEKLERQIMEMSMRKGVSLRETMLFFMKELEFIIPELKASLKWVREGRLYNLASPSMPIGYIQAIEGMLIRENWGCFSKAVVERKAVETPNVFESKEWEALRELAAETGFVACWSYPVYDSGGKVIATLSAYFGYERNSTEFEKQLLGRSVRLISLIVEKYLSQKQLEISNEKYEYLNKASNEAIYDWDLKTNEIQWGDGVFRIFGHDPQGPIHLLQGWLACLHAEDQERVANSLQAFIADPFANCWQEKYRFLRSDGTYAFVEEVGYLVRLPDGRPRRMIGSIKDYSATKELEIKLRKRSEYLEQSAEVTSLLLRQEDWYAALSEVFRIAGQSVQVDRVYYFEAHDHPETGERVCSQRYEWTSDGATPQINNPVLQNLSFTVFEDFFAPLKEGKPYLAIVKELPEGKTKQQLEEQEIKSVLVLPIEVESSLFGFIGFDDCTQDRIWKDVEINFLRNITSHLSASIFRRKNQEVIESMLLQRSKILESIQDGFLALDKEWKVTYCNREAETLLMINRDEVLGKSIWDRFQEALSSNFYTQYKTAIDTQTPVRFEEYFPTTNRWYDVSAFPSSEGLTIYFRDVSTKKQAELKVQQALEERTTMLERIRQTTERLQIILDATNDAIWDFDVAHQSLYWGKGFEKLFGHSSSEPPSFERWIGFIHEEDRPRIIQGVSALLKATSSTRWNEEYRFLKTDGEYAYVLDRAITIHDHSGRLNRVIGAMTDISYRKSAELELQMLNLALEKKAKDLERSNSELEQFAFVASHDLQEPLRMVSNFLTRLERKYQHTIDDKGKQYIHFAVDGAKRMKQIIQDLLDFSRIGRVPIPVSEVSLNEVMADICLLQQNLISDKQATVYFEKLPVIQTQRPLIQQALYNLVNNALKYGKPGVPPSIEVRSYASEGGWCLEVSDNGRGIDPEHHERVFVIFQRLSNRSEVEGTGIGLSMVKKILEHLGGTISLSSTLGEGSTFKIWLP